MNKLSVKCRLPRRSNIAINLNKNGKTNEKANNIKGRAISNYFLGLKSLFLRLVQIFLCTLVLINFQGEMLDA